MHNYAYQFVENDHDLVVRYTCVTIDGIVFDVRCEIWKRIIAETRNRRNRNLVGTRVWNFVIVVDNASSEALFLTR